MPLWLRALASFLACPGIVAVAVPALIVAADPARGDGEPLGLLPLVAGFAVLIWCVRDFYAVGRGTLAPWDPPQQLVIVGLYRLVRNPMYVGVLLAVLGFAITAGSPWVGIYAGCLAVVFHFRVILFEEPWCEAEFRDDWRIYTRAVRRWLPRLTPWRGTLFRSRCANGQ